MSWNFALAILGVVCTAGLLIGPFKVTQKTLRIVSWIAFYFNLINLLRQPELYQLLGLR